MYKEDVFSVSEGCPNFKLRYEAYVTEGYNDDFVHPNRGCIMMTFVHIMKLH